jgi:hypothetical protein
MQFEPNAPSAKPSPYLLLLVLVVFGLLRAVPLYVWSSDIKEDHDAYIALAEGWATSGTFGRLPHPQATPDQVRPTAYRPPLYPFTLIYLTRHEISTASDGTTFFVTKLSSIAVAVFHWILGVATCVMAVRIAATLQRSYYLSIVAGLMVALDPILIRQSSLVMTETLATFLAIAFWNWWVCNNHSKGSSFIFGGFLLGLSILCRPTAVVWFAFLLTWFTSIKLRQRTQLTWTNIAVIAATTILTISPWIVRNYVQFGKAIWATTHGGYTLVLANNPVFYQHLVRGHIGRQWNEDEFHARWARRLESDPTDPNFWSHPIDLKDVVPTQPSLSEIEDDHLSNRAAIACMRRQPFVFIESIFVRIGWLWALWPASVQSSHTMQTLIGAWYAATYLTLISAMIYALKYRCFNSKTLWNQLMPGLLLILALTAVHAVYWSNMRMRAVAMPVVYICLIVTIAAVRGEFVRERGV